MKNPIRAFFIILILSALSCNKENSPILNLDCQNFKNGIVNSDQDAVKAEISKLIADLNSKPTTNDETGHAANFDLLIDRINSCRDVNAELFCYSCILTLPAQTEILIRTDTGGQQIQRIIDILTPVNGYLEYITIHDAYEE